MWTVSIKFLQYNFVFLLMHAVVDCGSLQNPANGMVTVTETTLGSTARYSCSDSNYLLVGAAERTCQVNGMWSESVPQCSELWQFIVSVTICRF